MCIFGNINAGGTVSFQIHKFENYLMKNYFITVF